MEENEQVEIPYQIPMRNQGSNILFLTNPGSTLYKLELTYRSKMEDAKGNLRDVGDPLMNEEGINSVLGILHSVVNQVGIMSNVSKNDLPSLMNYIGDALAKDLMLNRVTYDITSPSARDKIYTSAMSLAYLTLRRALEEGDRRFWKGSVQEQKMTVENNSKKSSWLNKINLWQN